jgi:hypothetical protein
MEMLPEIPDEPLELGWTPKTQLDIPHEMVISIAQGMEEPDEIAARHGFIGLRWEKLKLWKPFNDAVAAHKAELDKSGYSFRVKAAFMAEDMLSETYLKAKSVDAPFAQKMQAVQFFTRVAGLEPKEDKSAQSGEGFSVTINMNGHNTTISGSSGAKSSPTGTFYDVDDVPQPGYLIAPLIDPTLFAEMAENREAA